MSMRIICMMGLVALGACTPDDSAPAPEPVGGADTHAAASAARGNVCYRMASSTMGRTSPLVGKSTTSPGWLLLAAGAAPDSGAARLIDADGAAMAGTWAAAPPDSIRILAFDDFLRVTIAAVRADSALTGLGVATSDAELVRDSSGNLRDLRREWSVEARRASCDSVPAIS